MAYLLKRRHSQLVSEPIIAIPPLFIFLFILSYKLRKINTFPANGMFFTKFSIFMDKKPKNQYDILLVWLIKTDFFSMTAHRTYVTVDRVLVELISAICYTLN